jgi:hypothetical protein
MGQSLPGNDSTPDNQRGITTMLRATLCLFVTLAASVAVAQGPPSTPKVGTPERKAIIDALRVPVEKNLNSKVVFQVSHLKVQNNWAFILGIPRQPGGKPIDYRNTPYQGAITSGAFDDGICALLKSEAGKWRVVQFVIGATDVPYEGWDKKYKAPAAIFR